MRAEPARVLVLDLYAEWVVRAVHDVNDGADVVKLAAPAGNDPDMVADLEFHQATANPKIQTVSAMAAGATMMCTIAAALLAH